MRANRLGKTTFQIVSALVVIVMITALARLGFLYFYRSAYPVHYDRLVEEYSVRNELPPSLVFAVIRTESGFDPNAQSHVEARGLMQITEETFEWAMMREGMSMSWNFDELYQEDINIRYGTLILRLLLDEFESVETALCAYHNGWGNVKRWLENPEYSPDGETLAKIPSRATAYYVDRVLDTQQAYERLYDFAS